ncbi:MAG: hypothetical protein ABMA15_14340 [Vicinamibacterales bacterium]
MNDALLVRRFERLGDLRRDGECFIARDRALRDPLRQVVALDQFHDECGHVSALLESVDLRDVRMIQRCEHFRFALKAREPFRIGRQRRR